MASTAPFGVSIDIFSPYFRPTSDPRQILLQAAWMRLKTAPGTYAEDPDYGLLVSDLENADVDPGQLGTFAARVRAQLELDDRVSEARVVPEIRNDPGGAEVTLRVTLVPEEGDEVAFSIALVEGNVEIIAEGAR